MSNDHELSMGWLIFWIIICWPIALIYVLAKKL